MTKTERETLEPLNAVKKPVETPLLSFHLFNERAQKLATSRFLAWLKRGGNKQPEMKLILERNWLAYSDLNSEDLDSFCLNLRLLIQDRDGFSIRCLSRIYEQFPEDYREAKDAFCFVRRGLNEFLMGKSIVQLQGRRPMSHRELLNVILYGGITHNNLRYYRDFLRLTKAGVFSSLVFAIFWNVILTLNSAIQKIAMLNQEVIEWEAEPTSSPKEA